jgi:hypothetical protein
MEGEGEKSKEGDIQALKDNGYDTDDVGRGNKAVNEKSVAKETDTTSGKASDAAHDARDDMEEDGTMGIPEGRHDK